LLSCKTFLEKGKGKKKQEKKKEKGKRIAFPARGL
jgi:hypothetical protein